MAILENIRKRTTILILIIGMALFAFVVSGIFTSDGFAGAKSGSTVGEINGEPIAIDAFRRKIESTSNRFGSGASSMQVVNNVWNQEVRNTILGQEFEDLGINIESDQILSYIESNPGYSQNPQFQNENGVFDEYIFREWIANLKENAPQQYQLWLQDEKAIIQMAKEQVYFNLIKSGLGATLKEGEFYYKLANDKVDIRYARVPYTSIADSTIKVSKEEISAYIKEHKEEFKQEDARDFQFVYFEEKPSLADENAIKDEVTALINDVNNKPGFKNTTDVRSFLESNSDLKFDTIYKAKNALPAKFADTLMTLAVGDLFGPYKDGDAYKVSRMMNRKPNGSVKSSHILITYKGAERANPSITRTKEEAEKKAKQILRDAKKSNADFITLARDNSDGPSASKGGDLGYYEQGMLAKEFDDYIFNNKVGSIDLVETDFGFHIIKVDEKQDIVQLATLSRAIEASEETINKLFTDATQFELDAKETDKSFLEFSKEKNNTARPVSKIKAMDENLPGLSAQRSIVQWAFNKDSKVGDIKRFSVNNGYAVVQLTGKYAEGLMSPEDASVLVLPKLRKQKKAAQIIAANQGKDLDAFAKDNNVSPTTAAALTMKSPLIPGAGREPLVVGTAFGLEQGETSGMLEGESGVFIVSVTKKEEAPKLDNFSTYANTVKSTAANRVNGDVFNALKEGAEIEDNRSIFY